MLPRASRAAALAIAVLGVVDPAISTRRTIPATVAVIDTVRPGAPGDVMRRVTRALDDEYRLVHAPAPGVAATIVVGDRLPAHASETSAPAFVVLPDRTGPAVFITRVAAPARAQIESRVPIGVTVEATGAGGRPVEMVLRHGAVVLDRVTREIAGSPAHVEADLTFVSGAIGPAALQIEVALADAAAARADLAIDVRRDRRRVLFFDGRPSWTSTFVRRELERDARFDVKYRTRTSTGVGTATADTPATLARLDAIHEFETIVVAAPDALPPQDLVGLDAFARRRGGSVVLLLDDDPDAALRQFVGVDRWQTATLPEPEAIDLTALDLGRLQATELIWPAALPARARVLATATAQRQPVLFDAPVGAGRVLVSGLADAWRYRGAAASPFAAMWPLLIGTIAGSALPPVEVTIQPAAASPGDLVDVSVVVRDALLAPPAGARQATVSATVDDGGGPEPIRLWPADAPGMFRGSLRASRAPGTSTVRVAAGDLRADAPMIVVDGARQPVPHQIALLEVWAATRGGRTFAAAEIDQLRAAVAAVVSTEPADVRSYPMRSAWWIVPFALALGYEWRERRRRGQR